MDNYNLSLESIEAICEKVNEFFDREKVVKRDKTRMCLLIEETLLKYRDKFGDDITVELHTVRRLMKADVQLVVYADKLDPFKSQDDDILINSLTTLDGKKHPIWRYVKGGFGWIATGESRNEILFSVPKETKISSPLKMLICVAVGVILGILTQLIFSEEVCATISNNYVLKLADAYTGMLNVMAILMIFFSLPLCIVQYGNASSFHKITRHTINKFVFISIIFAILGVIVGIVSFGVGDTSISSGSVAQPIFNSIIDFIPNSLVAPFINFNCMQVMIIGLCFGFSFLAMGNDSQNLVNAFDKCNLVAVLTNTYFAKFVHYYVGLMGYYLVVSGDYANLLDALWLVIAAVAACVVLCVGFVLYVCIKLKVGPRVFIKKVLPSFMINLSSASVGASFIVFFQEVNNNCGVELSFCGMSLNLGTVMFKPAYSIFLALSGFYAAYVTGNLSVVIIIQILFMAMILPMTIPNIQGGASAAIILMVSQLGFASASADMLISINSLVQFLIVPTNILCLQCLAIIQAGREGKIDLNKLRKRLPN